MPHYLPPNILRPLPIEEEEDGGHNHDDLETFWLIPGMLPEPYWDFNMGMDFNYYQMRQYLNLAVKTTLKDEEVKKLIKGLKTDPELVFHIRMSPQKLPSLVMNN